MRHIFLALALLASTFAFGQTDPNPNLNVATNSGQFTLSASAIALGAKNGTVVATDVGGTFAVSKNISLRSDNILAAGTQGYFGGFQYFLSSSKLLSKTNFDPSTFQFYVTGSGGEVFIGANKHPGFLAGGGINFDPTHTGKFTVNLIEVRAARLPYVQSGVTALVSGGVKIGF